MATFAPQPSEFEYPYYDARVAYDASLEAAINATEALAQGLSPRFSGLDKIAELQGFKTGSLRVAVAADSTSNDVNEWVRIWGKWFGGLLPETFRREYFSWRDDTKDYGLTVDSEGSSPEPLWKEMEDVFTRTTSDLVGSTSTNGEVWDGTGENRWSSSPSGANSSGAGALFFDTGLRDSKISSTWEWVTAGSGETVARRFYLGSANGDTNPNSVWGTIIVNASGNVSISLWKTIGGVTTALVPSNWESVITSKSAEVQQISVELELAIQNVTFRVTTEKGTTTQTALISESEYAVLGTKGGVMSLDDSSNNAVLKTIKISPGSKPENRDLFSVQNGSMPGASLAYHTTNMGAMYPEGTPIDVLIISVGHNYGTMAPSHFVAELKTFIEAFRAVHPSTSIILTSQNPQFTPAAGVVPHALRQKALKEFAIENMHSYIPAFEAFAARPDLGKSYVNPDGVHPSTPPSPFTARDNGSGLWAETFQAQIDAR